MNHIAYLCLQQVRNGLKACFSRVFKGSRLSLDWTWTSNELRRRAQNLKKRRMGFKTVATEGISFSTNKIEQKIDLDNLGIDLFEKETTSYRASHYGLKTSPVTILRRDK